MAIKCPKCNADNPDTKQFCGECGTQLPSLEDARVTETLETPKEELTTGSTFAERYQIIEKLGKGGMGKVYRAIDKKLNEEVANVGMSDPPGHFVLFCKLQKGGLRVMTRILRKFSLFRMILLRKLPML